MNNKKSFVIAMLVIATIISSCVSNEVETNFPSINSFPTNPISTDIVTPIDKIPTYIEGIDNPDVLFETGVTSTFSGLSITLNKLTFQPGCEGFLGFEIELVNNSDYDQVLSTYTGGGFTEPSLQYAEGNSTQECYQNILPDAFGEFPVKKGGSATYAIRIIDNLEQGENVFALVFFNQIEKLGAWYIYKDVETINTQPTSKPSQSTLPTKTPVPTICDAFKWKIIPESVLSFPSDSGFKYIVIPFVVKNDSPYWGQLHSSAMDAIAGNWTVTTEGGFVYDAGGTVETGDLSPYRIYGDSNMIGTEMWGSLPDFSNDSTINYPPGFVFRGVIWFFAGNNANQFPQMVFRVAETQNQFTITIPSLTVWCVHDGQSYKENLGPLTINSNTDSIEIPKTDLPLLSHNDISTPIVLDGIGKLEYVGMKRENPDGTGCNTDSYCLIKLLYNFTNASQGYETRFDLNGLYLLGDDGLIRPEADLVNVVAGPGKTVAVEIPFYSGPKTKKLMLAWHWNYFYQIYDLLE